MIKQETNPLLHWNYFSAIESDVLRLSRYVELVQSNYRTHSIEIVRLYLSACSEVDVVAGQLCRAINPKFKAQRIHEYRDMLRPEFREIEKSLVRIPRYGLALRPWAKWKKDETPIWWSEHQSVKHERVNNYRLANLKNMLNSVAALMVLVVLYYRYTIQKEKILIRPVPKLFETERDLAYIAPIYGAAEALVVKTS